jgi:hypothetical protein
MRLSGRAVLAGRVEGRIDRPLPFALAPGLEVEEVVTGDGRPLAWQRAPEHLWVMVPDGGPLELRFAFTGRPRRVERGSTFMQQIDAKGQWRLLDRVVESPTDSGQRRWLLDLHNLAWAPDPLMTVSTPGTAEPCWGSTSLELELARPLVLVPLPGAWQEAPQADGVRASWRGVSPHLPPVMAGAINRASHPGLTAAVSSAMSDVTLVLDHWQRAWESLPRLAETSDLVLHHLVDAPWIGSHSPRPGLEPPVGPPSGLVTLPWTAEMRTLPPESHDPLFAGYVKWTRAQLRYRPLAPRLSSPEPSPLRWFVWRLCVGLEWWAGQGGGQELVGHPANFFQLVDLWSAPAAAHGEAYQDKLDIVAKAVIGTLGAEQVERGLQSIVADQVQLTRDSVWRALAGDRSDELSWFYDEVICGQRIASPLLESVSVTERPDGWRIRISLVNDGGATTVVPLRVSGAQGVRAIEVRLEANGAALVEENLNMLPDQVQIDPNGEIVRRKVLSRVRWTRQGGVQ